MDPTETPSQPQQQQSAPQHAQEVRYQGQGVYQVFGGEFWVGPVGHTAKVAVVVLTEELTEHMVPFFITANFRTAVLATGDEPGASAFGVSENTFSRAVLRTGMQQLTCSTRGQHSRLLADLKDLHVVGKRSVRSNLAPLACLSLALNDLGKKDQDISKIVNDMYNLVPSTIPIDRPASPVHQASAAAAAAAQSRPWWPSSTAFLSPSAQAVQRPHAQPAGFAAAASAAAAAAVQLMQECGMSAARNQAGIPAAAAAAGQDVNATQTARGVNLSTPEGGATGGIANMVPSASAAAAAATAAGMAAATAATAALRGNAPAGYRNTTTFTFGDDDDDDLGMEPLPQTLPRRCYAPSQLVGDYGLQVHVPNWRSRFGEIPFVTELLKLEKASTQFNLARGNGMKRVRQTTWKGMEDVLKGAMGYLLVFSTPAIQVQQLSLWLLTPTSVVYFVDFLIARRCTAGHIDKVIGAVKRVWLWHKTTSGEDKAVWITWLENLQREVHKECAASSSRERNKRLPTMAKVLRWQLQVEADAKRLMQEDKRRRQSVHRALTAHALHDMARLSFFVGYGPTVRIESILGMRHPDYLHLKEIGCEFPGCRVQNCKGDRLERVAQDGQAKFRVIVAHGKTSDYHGNEPLKFILPPSWTRAVSPWVEEGHKVIAKGCSYLFPHMGKEVKKSTETENWAWFNNLQAVHSAPFNRISAEQCRHLYVGERMGEQAVTGPSNEAAAVVMGNSVERWIITYDVHRRDRLAAEAMRESEVWRNELLMLVQLEDKEAQEAQQQQRRLHSSDSGGSGSDSCSEGSVDDD